MEKYIQQDRLDASIQRRYLQFMKLNAETLWKQGSTQPAALLEKKELL